jgi:hypothetical protein
LRDQWNKLQEWLMMNVGSNEATDASLLLLDLVEAERDACAKEADKEAANWKEGESGWAACTTVANRIRNRTNER